MGLHRVHLLSWMTIWQKDQKKNPVNEIVYRIFFVAPRVGLEPTTARLTAACSTDWAIEDYNKNTVLSLDYVSGTFFSTFKTAYSFLHPTKLNLFLVLRHRLCLFVGSFINSLRSFISCLFPLRCLSALSTSHWKFFSWLLSFADRRLRSFLVKPSTY